MGSDGAGITFKGRVVVTAGGAVASAPISYIVQRVLASWGVLDDVSDALGRSLKVNITAPQAGWTIAAAVTLALYGIVLWRVWHRQIVHVHHKELTAVSEVTASLEMAVHRAPRGDTPPHRRLGLYLHGRLGRKDARPAGFSHSAKWRPYRLRRRLSRF